MLIPISLRARLIGIFAAMTLIVLICSIGLLWNTYQVDAMLGRVVQKDLVLYKIAQDMELALANQKGFLTYYFVDGDAKWLDSLNNYREIFRNSLDRARPLILNTRQRSTLQKIDEQYSHYLKAKDTAIENYQKGATEQTISGPHEKQRDVFFSLLDQCRSFSQDQWQVIMTAEKDAVQRSGRLRLVAWSSIIVFVVLCLIFIFILYRQILEPIRNLAIETGGNPRDSYMDEVVSLRHSLQGMMEDFDETHDELAKSRRSLLQAERMAVVGELAAGVAHTIRNPFTSIKMRMFSLSRSMNLTEVQNEDLQVISDEIVRIDKIVTNFLEFARPPKLTFTDCSLGELVDSVHTLLNYRLKQYKTELINEPLPGLPKISIDADQIKEVLLNLITNSCEAMNAGGTIVIRESREHDPELGNVAILSIKDTGPGIPETILYKVTTPFFTTREDGSGLGLAIVARIVREHGGKLHIPHCSDGCEILIKLPA